MTGTAMAGSLDFGNIDFLSKQALILLQDLIRIPRFSRDESKGAALIYNRLTQSGFQPERYMNNVWVKPENYDPQRPTLLLNSHIDTVRPNTGWKTNPFEPVVTENKLIGLGSNDAGASLACMFTVFLYFSGKNLPYNLMYSATAEEEVSGKNGIESILDKLGKTDLTIVGEPTGMQMAVAEKGLMVLDCCTKGKAGHAAREEGINAIYLALEDILWVRTHEFEKVSDLLGRVRMTVTQIEAGLQHNVIPNCCKFVIDVRANELYSNEELYTIISRNLKAEVIARSFRLKSSVLESNHPFISAGIKNGLICYGSPTTSDQAVIPGKTVKMGPGDSARSHTADEFIFLDEIKTGINTYIQVLQNFQF